MAIVKIKKIQIVALRPHKEKILEILQNSGVVSVLECSGNESADGASYVGINDLQKTELLYANLEFAINLLSKFAKKKGLFVSSLATTIEAIKEKERQIDYEAIIDKCVEIEDSLVKARNAISTFKSEFETYKPWKSLKIKLSDVAGTEETDVLVGSVKTIVVNALIEKLHRVSNFVSIDIIDQNAVDSCLMIIFSKELGKEIGSIAMENKFSAVELPDYKGLMKEYLKSLEDRTEGFENDIEKNERELLDLSKNLDDLKIIYDYFGWQKEKLEVSKKFGETNYSFIINAWIPEKNIESLKEDLKYETEEFEVTEIKMSENEVPPVIIRNDNFISPFETVTKIYGLPKYNEMDPTPYLSIFFILFFALCLTDAGYGLLMVLLTALALKYLKMEDGMKKLVKLLMYGGMVTTVIGALFGGWFSLTPDQVPEFLTKTTESGEKLLIFQKINALTDPITVLIISLALGFVQILMGVVIKFIHDFRKNNKKEALLDSGTWVFMLSGIGFYILAVSDVLPQGLQLFAKWWVIIASLVLIFTQGRDKKNIFSKLISGVLSLYALVGYMSDVLSYSRLLALGLATSIIGLAVNTIVSLAGGIPYIGWFFMIVVFIGGHIFNLVINTLGAFIHSGRLQFVEFFTKFMEGGGDEFRPLSKKSRYVYIKN
ncbi:V-type ATP synthase subunit I [Candidatus Peregrinibacteria bacterium]|nr:V-type ATP synthase subunit I [Candidatus Peregrinibacteria bacterium]